VAAIVTGNVFLLQIADFEDELQKEKEEKRKKRRRRRKRKGRERRRKSCRTT